MLQVVEPDVPARDKTLHILAKYNSIGKRNPVKPSSLRARHLPAFLEKNEEWCRQVTATYRARKKQSWEDFKLSWLADEFAIDITGIFIWARCYHLHVAVFTNFSYWTTHEPHQIEKCHVVLLYRGNNVFDDTRRMTAPEHRERYKELTRNSRRIERHLTKRKAELRLRVQETSESDSESDVDYSEKDEEKEQETEIDLEEMLEQSGKRGTGSG